MSLMATKSIPFHQAMIEEDDIQSVVSVMRGGWLTTGARTREFEQAFAQYTSAEHAVALSSCTAALHLALAAIGLREGDEVILPTMTFSSTSEVVLYFKAHPVFVDCLPNSFQADPSAIERAITPATRAIIVVHFAGSPANLDAILDIARRHKLKVIEDAAHALPTLYKGRMIGSFSDITCFSFYATKTLTTGEGGMVTTASSEYADRIRLLSLHGISKDAYKRYTTEGTWRYEILDVGYKYNMTDMQAALGLSQLAKCDAMREKRERLAERYIEAFSPVEAFECPFVENDTQHAWHLFVLQLNLAAWSISRDRAMEELKQQGILTSVHFIPLHTHPLYRENHNCCLGQFPHAERHFERSLSLPLYPGMKNEDSARVIEVLLELARKYRR